MAKEPWFSITKDQFRFDTFRAGGKGGQNQNKVESGVRCVHEASGARGEARDSRDQLHNRRNAFVRCVESKTFQVWLQQEIARRAGVPTPEERVQAWMQPNNIRVDYGA